MYVGLVEMACLMFALTILVIKVCQKKSFSYIVTLICCFIVSDISVSFLSVAFYLEQRDQSTEERLSLSLIIGIATFLFNIGNLTMHWLFSFKYWVIAREVPKLFDGQNISYNEKTYKVVKWIGLIFNILVCLVLGYFRGKLTYQTSGGKASGPTTTSLVQIFYQTVTLLELVSAIFLADALRRIMRHLKENPYLQANEKIMWLHIIMLVVHVVVFSVCDYFIFRAFKDPNNSTKQFE